MKNESKNCRTKLKQGFKWGKTNENIANTYVEREGKKN